MSTTIPTITTTNTSSWNWQELIIVGIVIIIIIFVYYFSGRFDKTKLYGAECTGNEALAIQCPSTMPEYQGIKTEIYTSQAEAGTQGQYLCPSDVGNYQHYVRYSKQCSY
jgi:predicted membrane-bound mannosyltransferase